MKPKRVRVCLSILFVGLVLGHAPSRADEADDQYAVAAGHYAQQRWKFAVEEFETFLEKHPQDPRVAESLFFLGEALVQLGCHADGQARFQEYLRRWPTGPHARSALFRAGEAAYLAGKTAEAKPLLRQFIEKYPNDELNAYALPYLGEVALAEKDDAAAESYFRRGLDQFPDGRLQEECRFGLARVLEHRNQNAEAERLYLALATKPNSRLAADAQFRLGAVQYALGKYAEAAKSFAALESKWEKHPQIGAARLGHGWALLRLDRPKEAAAKFEQAATDPRLAAEARYWQGMAEKAQKEWSAAAKTLLAAAAADPNGPLVTAIRFHAGDAFLHAGDYPSARRQFEAVLQATSSEEEWVANSLYGLCQSALRERDFEAIERRSAEFTRRFPKHPLAGEVRRLLARSLIERKEYGRAADVLGDPSALTGRGDAAAEGQYLLALAYEGLKRYDEALAALKPALASAEASLKRDALATQASILMAAKRFAEAVAPLEAFLTASPSLEASLKARASLAICHARARQLNKAKSLYAELLKQRAEGEWMAATTEQLAEAAYEAGDTKWSEDLFGRLAKDEAAGKQLRGLAGLGWSQFKAGRLEEAAATFGQVLASNPPPELAAETALVRGQVLERLQKPDDAFAMYELVISRHPTAKEMPHALLAVARLRHRQKKYEQAAAFLERLLREFPKFPELDAAIYDWAWVLADQGKTEESSKAFERLRREFPQSSFRLDATFRLAQRAFADKQYSRARELASEVVRENAGPEVRENAMFLLGQIAAGEGKWQEAFEAFTAVVKEFPSGTLRVLAEYGAAEAAFRRGEGEAALSRFQKLAADLDSRDKKLAAVALLRQAQVLAQQEKWDEALRLASQLDSFAGFEEQYEADYIVGRCLARRAEFEKARERYRRVIASPGGRKTLTAANAQLMIAETYFHQKNYESAVREYLKTEILYAFPAVQAAALLQAGKCHEALGEWKQAAECYARLIDRYRDTVFAKEAAERIAVAKQKAEATARQ
jgi:TolA-binding protein